MSSNCRMDSRMTAAWSRIARLALEALGRALLAADPGARGQALEQHHPVVERPGGRPQCALELASVLDREAVGRVRVAHGARKPRDAVLDDLVDATAAVRAGEAGALVGWAVALERGARPRARGRRCLFGRGVAAGRRGEPARDVGHGEDRIQGDVGHRAPQHSGVERLDRILHEGAAPAGLDGRQAGGAIVAGAAEQDADGAPVVGLGGRTHRRVDRGAHTVLPRAAR